MRVVRRLAVLVAASTAVLAAGVVTSGPARADDVQVLPGARFPTTDTYLTYVACGSFGADAVPPGLRITLGPGTPPLGRRSAWLVPAGAGTAAGPYVRLDSMATGTAVVPVHAAQGTTGVSYAWVKSPDAGLTQAWLGRADVQVPAGAWTAVDAATLAYTWSLVDLVTGEVVGQAPPASVRAFTGAHGDGPGYVALGMGCDGHPFHLDAVRAGDAGAVTTYDVEGLSLTTVLTASALQVDPGAEVVLTATVTDPAGRVMGDSVVLQERAPDGTWRPVGDGEPLLADVDGLAHATVTPEVTTEYRWHRPEGPYADEGWSEPVRVVVGPPAR